MTLLELLGGQHLQIFGRILVEIFAAGLAAKPDFMTLVIEHDGLAHLAELVTGNNAGAGFVGFCVVMAVMGEQRRCHSQGEYRNKGCENDIGGLFHGFSELGEKNGSGVLSSDDQW